MEKDIDTLEFSPLAPHEIPNVVSVVEITNPITTVEFEKNNSLFDIRMGAFKNVKCGTCSEDMFSCPGHHGHISLVEPCLNPYFILPVLKKILSLYCFKCFKKKCTCVGMRVVEPTEEKEHEPPRKRRKKIKSEKAPKKEKPLVTTKSTIMMVYHSKTIKNKVKKLMGQKISFKWRHSGKDVDLRMLYRLISGIKKKLFIKDFPNYKRYESLNEVVFIHHLPVLPTTCRPPNMVDGEWKAENISRLYNNVIKANINLKMKRSVVPDFLVEEYHNMLQSHINILFDVNNTNLKLQALIKQNGGLRQRIDGKKGRLRLNLMGKRVDFSARTVLSGDPMLGINEVGIPSSVAETLTIPVKVNRYNINSIRKYKLKYLFKPNNRKYDLSLSGNLQIEIGDVVERCLVDGDIVAVNRQPTLHRGSIIACYVRIFPCSTFRLNYSTMITLNADTDGDEINIHVPQDLESRAELENLMLASNNIVCSQACKPLIGCTQDSLLGCYKLSQTLLTEHDFMDILTKMDIMTDYGIPCVVKGRQRYYSGNRIITTILNYLEIEIKRYEPNDNFLMINNYIIKGVLNKSIVGVSDNSIIHHIYLMYNHKIASDFIHFIQLAATAYLDIYGFSVGISDCIVKHDPIHFDRLEKHLESSFIKNGGKWSLEDEAELTDALGELTKIPAPSGIHDNRLLDMINSGAKGSIMNFNQITNVVGQQIEIEGRISKQFSDKSRTLPHYSKFDTSAASRGLVKNSFIKGLSPAEFFMHAVGGRIGLIDTACKTAKTGDQYRRLVKTLEPLVTKDVGKGERMVINSTNDTVVQFNYGENGLDGTYLKMKH